MSIDEPMPKGRPCGQCGAENSIDVEVCAQCAAPFETAGESMVEEATGESPCCNTERVGMFVAVLLGVGTGLLVLVTAAVVVGETSKIGVFFLLGLALVLYAGLGFLLGRREVFHGSAPPAISEYGLVAAYAHLGLSLGIATLLPSEFNNAALMGLGVLPLVLFVAAVWIGDKLSGHQEIARDETPSAAD